MKVFETDYKLNTIYNEIAKWIKVFKQAECNCIGEYNSAILKNNGEYAHKCIRAFVDIKSSREILEKALHMYLESDEYDFEEKEKYQKFLSIISRDYTFKRIMDIYTN